jgi:hypothetical protein
MRKLSLVGLLGLWCVAGAASAYIGPGAGLSLVGSLFGWIIGIFLTLFAIVLWPLRYLFRRIFRRRKPSAPPADTDASSPAAPALRFEEGVDQTEQVAHAQADAKQS